MRTPEIVCIGALRTPMGRFGGSFKEIYAYDLAAPVIRRLLDDTGFTGAEIDEVLIGHCRQAGNGPNPGRTASVRGGVSTDVPVATINMACPSGMKALEIGAMRLSLGAARFVLVGGMESMSTMPYLIKDCRWTGFRMGNKELLDGWADSTDPLIGQGMGHTAENLCDKYGITREEQDRFAADSQEKAFKAREAGAFTKEIVPIEVDGAVVAQDETIRYPVNMEKMGRLKPVFRKDGSVTAANACAMADGAAFMLLTTREIAQAEGLPILAGLAGFSQCAVAPATMGDGPGVAIPRLLGESGLTVDDLDLLEVNEAFAVQVLANERVVGWDRGKLNVHGGAIALGHPTGCTGVRITVSLIHALAARGEELGVASLCGGGGVAMATLVRRLP
ncbi:MAG: thiolase family protein [Pseudomonadota bacterium]